MAYSPGTRGIFYHSGTAALCLFSLIAVTALLLRFFPGKETAAPEPTTHRDWARLRGPVKIVATEEVGGSDAAHIDGQRFVRTVVYDRAGNRTEASWDTMGRLEIDQPVATHSEIDTINPLTTPFHDPGNRLAVSPRIGRDLLRCLITLFPLLPGVYQRAYFGSNGRLEERYVHYDDPAGKLSRWSRYNAEGNLIDRTVYRYDQRGNCTESIRYGAGDSLDYHWKYTYDQYDNVVEKTGHDKEGKLKYKLAYQYEYDDWGNWITKTAAGWTAAVDFESGGAEFLALKVTTRNIIYY